MQYKFEKPVQGTIGAAKYQCTIEWRNGKFIADESVSSGGRDLGPDPYTLLLSSLASCILVIMRMYIDSKGWDIAEIKVNVNMYNDTLGDKTTTVIDMDIQFPDAVEEEQKVGLLEIAKQCPISKILENDIKVRAFLFKGEETEKEIKYANNEITVVWKPDFCQHAQRCWRQLPDVFDYKKRPWVTPFGAPTEKIIEQVKRCPSGALSFFYNTKQSEE